MDKWIIARQRECATLCAHMISQRDEDVPEDGGLKSGGDKNILMVLRIRKLAQLFTLTPVLAFGLRNYSVCIVDMLEEQIETDTLVSARY